MIQFIFDSCQNYFDSTGQISGGFFSECDSCQKDFDINCLEWCKNYWLPQQQNFTRYNVRININSSTFDLKTIYAIDVLR